MHLLEGKKEEIELAPNARQSGKNASWRLDRAVLCLYSGYISSSSIILASPISSVGPAFGVQ